MPVPPEADGEDALDDRALTDRGLRDGAEAGARRPDGSDAARDRTALGVGSRDADHLARVSGAAPGRPARPCPARPVPDRRLPGALGGPDAAHLARELDVHDRGRRRAGALDVGGAPGLAERGRHRRHPLRHEVVEARHGLERRLRRHATGRGRAREGVRARLLRRRLHDQPPAGRPHRRQGLGCVRLRRRAARPGARRARAAAGAAPLLLEEREVGPRPAAPRRGRARLLGTEWLPHPRRSLAGAAVLGRLTWLAATVAATHEETPRVRTLTLDAPGWADHRAGQHLDVRLTAEDGYQAERSYSIASAPGDALEITVERLEDGEVSLYLV